MNKSTGINKPVKTAVIFLLILLCILSGTRAASAAVLRTIPSTDLSVSYSNKLIFGYHNYTAKWNGVSGKMIKGKYNYDLLCVPIKTKTGTFTYTDFLDLTFTNVGEINGRQLDAKVHFNSITVGKRNASGERSDNYFAVCYLADESLWMSSTISGIGAGYRAPKTIDLTTTIYWHDTGQTVSVPFFQCLQDIDAGANYYKEAWEAKSGFSGIFYKYSSCFLKFTGNKAVTPSATDVSGTDSLFKAGFYAPTSGGVFRGVFTEGNCATQFIPYSAYTVLPAPVKTAECKEKNECGDEITYTVSQKIGKFYSDTMTHYSSFVIEDNIPEGLEYKEAAVYNEAGENITSKGTLVYEEETGRLSFTMGAAWLSDTDNYSGQNISLKIKTVAKKPENPLKKITNSARTVIDKEIILTSNEVSSTIALPYGVSYVYRSGTEGKKLPEAISAESGKYAVNDDGVYYSGDKVTRRENPQEGTVYRVTDDDGIHKGSWVLSWDADEITVKDSDVTFVGTWRYVHTPKLKIIKRIEDSENLFVEEHGPIVSVFKITGETGGKSRYRSISFDSEVISALKTSETYTDENGCTYRINDGYMEGETGMIDLPEDDYTVEEIASFRFKNTVVCGRYHGGASELEWFGDNGIKVPLKFSSFGKQAPGYDASYASVTFENKKVRWDKFSHGDIVINRAGKAAVQ